jgi:PEGA domain-containing protein
MTRTSTSALRASNLMACATLCLACASSPAPRPAARGTLQVRCQPADAEVYVDDHFAGNCSVMQRRPLQHTVGPRRMEIRRPGFFTEYRTVNVATNQTSAVQVSLRAVPAP